MLKLKLRNKQEWCTVKQRTILKGITRQIFNVTSISDSSKLTTWWWVWSMKDSRLRECIMNNVRGLCECSVAQSYDWWQVRMVQNCIWCGSRAGLGVGEAGLCDSQGQVARQTHPPSSKFVQHGIISLSHCHCPIIQTIVCCSIKVLKYSCILIYL